MKLLSFNVRGIGGGVKEGHIRNTISREGIDFACFQETKAALIDSNSCQRIWGNYEIEWLQSPAVNRG